MRRRFQQVLLRAIVFAVVCCVPTRFETAPIASEGDRALSFYNIHTKETLSFVFKREGRYVPDALEKFNHIMRDWRQNASTRMDPQLLDLIWEMHRELGSQKPVYVISGYRSSATNEALRLSGGGQAKNSRHLTGQAVDIHFPDVPVKQLRNSALIRERGGVGYYPTSAIPFVHVDTGNVRHWPKLPRQELAILFPSGRSKHVPADGKPLTREDFRIALADLKARGGELPIAVQRALNKPAAPTPMLASLGPNKLPLIGRRENEGAPASAAAPALPSPVPEARAIAAFKPLPEPILPAGVRDDAPALPAAAPEQFGRGFVTAALPLPRKDLSEDQIARAPDYDDDHPEESNYQPFAILPFLTETPLAYLDLSSAPDGILRKNKALFSNGAGNLVIEFEQGPQYEGMFWAQRFTGKAVNGAIAKYVPNEAITSTVMKTASGWPGR